MTYTIVKNDEWFHLSPSDHLKVIVEIKDIEAYFLSYVKHLKMFRPFLLLFKDNFVQTPVIFY